MIIALCSNVGAEEKKYDKLLDYEGVTVREVAKDKIRIMHNGGIASIPIEDLPAEIREELGMSLEGVAEHREKAAEEEAAAILKARLIAANQKLLKASYMEIVHASVFQVVDGGILAHVSSTSDGTFRQVPTYKTETNRVGTALSGYRNVKRKVFTCNKKEKNIEFHDRWLIFVSCDNNGLVDGKGFAGDVWADGTYSYATAIGGGKTIPKYTANPEDIIKR